MEMMAMELMEYSLNWTNVPFYSVVYSRQDNFASKKDNCRQFFGKTVQAQDGGISGGFLTV